jgi:hypothetical protein
MGTTITLSMQDGLKTSVVEYTDEKAKHMLHAYARYAGTFDPVKTDWKNSEAGFLALLQHCKNYAKEQIRREVYATADTSIIDDEVKPVVQDANFLPIEPAEAVLPEEVDNTGIE